MAYCRQASLLHGLLQVGFKNFVGSMGAPFVPLLVADRVLAPPEFARVTTPAPSKSNHTRTQQE